jgi:hypothetical protein
MGTPAVRQGTMTQVRPRRAATRSSRKAAARAGAW